MKILVVNCGSSSLKYKLYDFPKGDFLFKGVIEKIGEAGSTIATHEQGMHDALQRLLKEKAIQAFSDIGAVGHRVVHGAEFFRLPRVVDDEVIAKIKECSMLAPLHNPANTAGILACKNVLENTTQIAVFDTSFHQSIPDYAYLYAIPMEYYKKYGIRKYGFHGTSHQCVAQEAARKLKKPLQELKLITCHLGNGCSITAIDKGKSIDTSMGFTPLEGLIMGTRCGDIDMAAVFHIMEKESISPEEMDKILNKKSGLLAISGVSNDLRTILQEKNAGDQRCELALQMFMYRIKKYIGAYLMVLGGADAICFAGGIGENNPDLIKDFTKDIRKVAPDVKILVIPTDEEFMIASLTYDLVK